MSQSMFSEQAASPRSFVDEDLRASRFVRCDLSGVVMRATDLVDADIDVPWMRAGEDRLLVNGVDVMPLVEAELDRRFPGRALRSAEDRDGLVAAFDALERAWERAIERAQGMPGGVVDVSVDGEFSFSQTVRHLVMAMDTWFAKAIHRVPEPYHPLGQPNHEYATDGYDPTVFEQGTPPFADVLAVYGAKLAEVRAFVEGATPALLDEPRTNPWGEHQETVRACLHTILEEGWAHLRYALRDLDVLAARAAD